MNTVNQSTLTQLCSLLRPAQAPAIGVTEPALKKKPIAVLLGQMYGEPNAKTADKPAISTPLTSSSLNS